MTNGFTGLQRLAIAIRSVSVMATLKLRGVSFSRVTCEGHRPVWVTRGDVSIGQLATSGYIAPPQIGAGVSGQLRIGRNVFINQGASIVSEHRITVEDDVRIGDFAAIYDTDHHAVVPGTDVRFAPVTLEQGCWIGRGACVLPGVTVGAGSVVAAGAVVTTSIPSGVVVAGVPAVVISRFEFDPSQPRA